MSPDLTNPAARNASFLLVQCLLVLFLASAPLQALASGAVVARPDRYVLGASSAKYFPVLMNDTVPVGDFGEPVLALATAPAEGVATVKDQQIRYEARPNWVGSDTFRYRVCNETPPCVEAAVTVVVRPEWNLSLFVPGRSGHADWHFSGMPALPRLQGRPTPLVSPRLRALSAAPDSTPASAWDNDEGRAFALLPFEADPAADRIVTVRASDFVGAGDIDLYIGLDLDGNGQPSTNEVRCVESAPYEPTLCEAAFTAAEVAGASHFWVMMHHRFGLEEDVALSIFEVPLVEADGSLVATAPGQVEAGASFTVRLGWDDQNLYRDGEEVLGYLRFESAPGVPAGEVPVHLTRSLDEEEALLLAPGEMRSLVLDAGSSHQRIYFDVPEGTTSLQVEATGNSASAGFDLIHDIRDHDPAVTYIDAPDAQATPAATLAAGGGSLVLDAPLAGRWYARAWNSDIQPRELGIRFQLQGQGPETRPGSYFNAARPGSGVFLYPAGDQWAGLWYTYFQDKTATWYYLQGDAPAPDGQWTGNIYRAAWHGDGNTLTQVGVATVSSRAQDVFTFSYMLDGLGGSQPMSALGRGCPVEVVEVEDEPVEVQVDVSSHWFDPARAGTGYSVQMWDDYEYYAAFVYDAQGVPRFLAAERSGYGGPESVLGLQQLAGSCPTCTFEPGFRYDAGTLLRRISDGTLESIELDVEYSLGVNGIWSSSDQVQTLGGPGTTQGCAP